MSEERKRLYKLNRNTEAMIACLNNLGYEVPDKNGMLDSSHTIESWLNTLVVDVAYLRAAIDKDDQALKEEEARENAEVNKKANRLIEQLRFHNIINDTYTSEALLARVRSAIRDGVEPRMDDVSE